MTAYTIQKVDDLIFIGDAQHRCLLLADAPAARALALMVLNNVQDESRPLRSKHYREILKTVPQGEGGLRITRVDAEAFLQEDADVIIDSDLLIENLAQRQAFYKALMQLVPAGTRNSARLSDDLWTTR